MQEEKKQESNIGRRKMPKKYDKDKIISKLTKSGFKLKYKAGTRGIQAIACFDRKDIGIKTWSYLDFLGLPLIKKASKNHPKKERKQITRTAKYHYFRWFAKEEWANEWANALKNHLKTPVKIYINFINNEYRVWAETIITNEGEKYVKI